MTIAGWAGVKARTRALVIDHVNRLRTLQDCSGAVVGKPADAATLLGKIVTGCRDVADEVGQREFAKAFAEDAERWVKTGLELPPDFRCTRDAYRPPADGQPTFFVGPTLAQNGPPPRGHHFEAFLSIREEPEPLRRIATALPHPLNPCQSTRLQVASTGFGVGNCIVFFPEYISCREKVATQTYAIFFFNKFRPIYLCHTMPTVRASFGEHDSLFSREAWLSAELDERETYVLRCIWGYLHDYFHHQGPRGLQLNLQLKQDWMAGVLEELKVDCQVVLYAIEHRIERWRELVEFVLFERMFRYPLQGDRNENFDSATGLLLFKWLRSHEALVPGAGAPLRLDFDRAVPALAAFVEAVMDIERIADDQEFLSRARAFVTGFLPGAPDLRAKAWDDYERRVRSRFQGDFLDMRELAN